MCAIAGILRTDGEPVDRAALVAMRDAMRHRGPDDAGLFVSDDRRIGLAHRRLSIVDLSETGHQPMHAAEGRWSMVFNGEIYDFQAHRAWLEARGHSFRGSSDSEVLLALWAESGPACLDRLEGMFAFAVYDHRERRLWLVRDRVGVKPLVYARVPGGFAFASEAKAFFEAGLLTPEVDREAVYHYLSFAAVPAPASLFAGVRKLPAGSLMTVDADGSSTVRRWWGPGRFTPGSEVPLEEAAVRVRERLEEATRLRMICDVPFGAYLSGGLDSSANVALMSRILGAPVRTFSVSAPGPEEANELDPARRAARHYGARHTEFELDEQAFLRALPGVTWHLDEPVADPACVPLYHLSKATRQAGCTVVQVGEGSDELFFGYHHYRAVLRVARHAWGPYTHLPRALRRGLASVAKRRLPAYVSDALRRAAEDEPVFWGGAIGFWEVEKRELLRDGPELPSSAGVVADLLDEHHAGSPIEAAILALELRLRLPELILMRVDKMTMAHSVEAREPFLDSQLIEYAASLPLSVKLRDGVGKLVLREAMRDVVPTWILERSKMGFCGSATTMVTGRVRQVVERSLRESRLLRELVAPGELGALIARARRQPRQNNYKLWVLFSLALWYETFFGGDVEAMLRES